MIDIIKPTVPLTGTEAMTKIRPSAQGESTIVNIPDPTRVTKLNQQNVYSDRQPEKWLPNFQSNFDQFLTALKGTPNLTEAYTQLFARMGNLVQAGLNEGFAQEIASYMQLLKMSEGELLGFLKAQQGSSIKFTGPFFDMLRQVLGNQTTPELKGAIVEFLQKYDSMSSNGHILNNLVANLRSIALKMPHSMSVELNEIIEKLVTPKGTQGTTVANSSQLLPGQPSGMAQVGGKEGIPLLNNETNMANINILKSQIVPFLSNYIGSTHDFGAIRDVISMMVLNLARYETGTEENFVKAFRSLMAFPEVQNLMKDINPMELEKFFLANKPANENNPLIDKLVNIISRGMNGEAGSPNRAIFQNVLSSLLINESVYMPLVHLTLPADVNGQQFFSEVWIDPNSKEGDTSKGGDGEDAIKLLIKFDIRDVGFFETVILLQGDDKVDIALFYPEQYAHLDRAIKEGIGEILSKNDLKIQSLAIGKVDKPLSISEVFPKIYEGRNAVNVSV